ncbi:MAG: ABC transporter ATP-binding protein [Bacteroidales bacterium]
MNTLRINALSLTYKNGVNAVQNISMELHNGMFGILGPNGAGKSSLMKIIAGLQKPDSGSIEFNGGDVLRNPLNIQKSLGFLPQDFGVYPKTTALRLLHHLAILKGVGNKKERQEQVLSLLERVNLIHHKDQEVYTFSGGMKQRFGVAQALLGRPEIIIVDEPTAGLDPEERNRFNAILSELSDDMIVILSTHLVEDVRNLCAGMAIMDKGRIIAQGKPKERVDSLEGTIWQKTIHKDQLGFYQQHHSVIRHQLIERKWVITLHSRQRPEGFAPAPPTLEDVYFHALNQQPS